MPAPPRNDEEGPIDEHYDDELGSESQQQQEGEEEHHYDEEEEEVLQEFDENGNPIDYDENGQQIVYEQQEQQYDEDGNPIEYDENVQYVDENGQPLPQYDENGNPIDYDENGHPIEYDENGQQIVYEQQEQQYDEDGNPIEYDENVQYVDENGQPVQPPQSDPEGKEPYMMDQPPGTEYAANTAEAATGDANNKASSTQRGQQDRRDKMWVIILCVAIILILIIVGIVLGTQLTKDADKSVDVPAPGPPPTASWPTGSPMIQQTMTPTQMPTFAPTFGPLTLEETQGWSDPNPLSGFGSAVTLSVNRLAIASPNGGTTSSGLVSIYDPVETERWLQAGIDFGTAWTLSADITPDITQLQAEFGSAIDFTPDGNSSGILIGAPGVNLASGASPAGAAYFYRFDGSAWVQDGNAMQGGVANERFGASVGTSTNFRAVIGAPDNNQGGTLTGKVYIYEFQTSEWVDKSPQDPPLIGQAENSRFGASVDMSPIGDLLVIGEPGANSFTILERDSESGVWSITSQLPHRPIGGDLGSSVKILTKNYIAVGAESAQQDSGSVRIYTKDPIEGKWVDFGPIIYGDPGDRIGKTGAMDGGLGPDGPEIVVGTEQGFIKRFDLDAETWYTRFETDAGMPVVDAVGYTPGSVLAGSDGKVNYSEVEGYIVPPPTTPTAPTAPSATAPSAPSAPTAGSTPPSAPTATTPSAPVTLAPSAPNASVPSALATVAPTTIAPAATAPSVPTAITPAPAVPVPQSPSPAPGPTLETSQPGSIPPTAAATDAPVAATPTPASVPTAATLSPSTTPPVSVPTAASLSPSTTAPVTGTLSPTLTKGWVLTDGPITVNAGGSGFGSAVALGNNLFAAGLPSLTVGTNVGAVQSFEPDANGEWISESPILFESGTAKFGAAVDIASTSLIVGDPESKDALFQQPFGAAYVYVQQGNSWSALGAGMRPDPTPPEVQGRFGAAVATASSVQRVAVGAPASNIVATDNSIQLRAGRVYTWGYNGTGWEQAGEQLFGAAEDDQLGTSIDMTGDGNGLLVGAPGAGSSPGSVAYYKWSGTGWMPTFTVSGTSTESLGTNVAILSQDGSLLAASGQGVVRVYSQTGAQVGSDIVGVTTSLTGANGRVIIGLSSGFRAYDFDAAVGDWVEVETGPSTSSPIISISTSADAGTVVAGLQSQEIFVYTLV